MLMKKQTATRLTTTTTMERRASSATPRPQLHQQQQQQQLVTSSSSSSYQSPEYIRRQYQERQKVVENDVLQEELLMRELEAKLARLQKPSTMPSILVDTSQAAIMPSEQAAGHIQSTALVLKTKMPPSIPVATSVAPLAGRPSGDHNDQTHPIPALLPMHVPLQSFSILQVGRLLQHHNLLPYIDSFARNCVDGVTLAETTLSDDDLQELGVHIRLHRVRLLKVVQEGRQHGVPPAVLYHIDHHQREESFSNFHDDDDDDDNDSGNEDDLIGASSTDALDAAIAGRESVASFLSLMGGEGKEGGIVGQEAATMTDRDHATG